MRFVGEYPHTLDAKGRIVLPARFRDAFATGLFLAPGHERCVTVFTSTAYDERMDEVERLPADDEESRALNRVLTNSAHADVPDSQGRVVLPQRLRDYAGLDREVTVCGSGKVLEIWDREAYEAYRADVDARFSSLNRPRTA